MSRQEIPPADALEQAYTRGFIDGWVDRTEYQRHQAPSVDWIEGYLSGFEDLARRVVPVDDDTAGKSLGGRHD